MDKLKPKMLHELTIPDCVRAAWDADHSREFLAFVFREDETKGKRAQTEIIPLDFAGTLKAYLDVRHLLFGGKDPGTLFLQRDGRALRAHNLRSLVRRLARNHCGEAVPPHLWRDVYAAHFRVMLAIGAEADWTAVAAVVAH